MSIAAARWVIDVPSMPSVPVLGLDARYPIRRIFCVGRNYEAHAREMGAGVNREAPFYFNKSAWDYVPSGAALAYPPSTGDYHYEMELVVAIGAPASRVSGEQALRAVYGYACGLDMTRRDLQAAAKKAGLPWDTAKDFEQSAVVSGIAPASRIGHPARGRIELKVNDVVKQCSDLGLMIHPVPAIIADLSKFYDLLPGDLIYTGTPEGVGAVRPGDRLEGSIETVGTISATIVQSGAAPTMCWV